MQLSHNRARLSPEIVFFPDGSGTPIPVSTIVKDLGIQADSLPLFSALKAQIRLDD